MRFVLLDRITALEPGRRGTAVKNVALSEDFFDDHFPLKPIMPGVLILEGLAELAGLVLEEGRRALGGPRVKALLSIVEQAKFRRPVRPGDRLEYEVEVESVNELGARVAATARLEGRSVADCRLVFSFHEFENPRLAERQARIVALLRQDEADESD